jgi:hypothetical protein
MVSREELRLQGLRAYEVGRVRAAARIAFVLVPVVLLCLLESRGRPACACVAAALIGVCVWLRWRDRRGFEVVSSGFGRVAFRYWRGSFLTDWESNAGLRAHRPTARSLPC